MEHPVFGLFQDGIPRRSLTETEAFIWLIEHAAWKKMTVNIAGKPIELDRGQLSFSYRFMSSKLGWSINKYNGWLKRLETWGILTIKTDTAQSIITICNYSKYQDVTKKTDTAPDTGSDTDPDTAPDTKKKEVIKEVRKNKKEIVVSPATDFQLQPSLPEIVPTDAEAVALYNEMAKRAGLPLCMKLSPARKSHLIARLKDAGGLEGWKTALATIENSEFLTGKNNRGWKANFDFVTKDENFTKIMEGTYNAKSNPNHGRPKSAHDSMLAGYAFAGDYAERNSNE